MLILSLNIGYPSLGTKSDNIIPNKSYLQVAPPDWISGWLSEPI